MNTNTNNNNDDGGWTTVTRKKRKSKNDLPKYNDMTFDKTKVKLWYDTTTWQHKVLSNLYNYEDGKTVLDKFNLNEFGEKYIHVKSNYDKNYFCKKLMRVISEDKWKEEFILVKEQEEQQEEQQEQQEQQQQEQQQEQQEQQQEQQEQQEQQQEQQEQQEEQQEQQEEQQQVQEDHQCQTTNETNPKLYKEGVSYASMLCKN
jgi:hypothetical protein